jgi:hypothetical protein
VRYFSTDRAYELEYLTEKKSGDIIVCLLHETRDDKYYIVEYNLLVKEWSEPIQCETSDIFLNYFLITNNGLYTTTARYNYPALTKIVNGDSRDVNETWSVKGVNLSAYADYTSARRVSAIDFISNYYEKDLEDFPVYRGIFFKNCFYLMAISNTNAVFFYLAHVIDKADINFNFINRVDLGTYPRGWINEFLKARNNRVCFGWRSTEVRLFDEDLNYIATLSRNCYTPKIYPPSISISENYITIIDSGNHRYIAIFDLGGTLIEQREIITSAGRLKDG